MNDDDDRLELLGAIVGIGYLLAVMIIAIAGRL